MSRIRDIAPALLVMFVSVMCSPAQAERVVVVFGTSLTAYGSWPEELVESLKPGIPEGLRLERVAAPGKNSDWALGEVERVISARPDIVIIEFGINDADIIDGVNVSRSRINHQKITNEIRAAMPSAKVALMTTNPAFGISGLVRPKLDNYYKVYRDMSNESNLYLIDVHPQWLSALDGSRRGELLPDGLHPTNAANTEIAVPFLRKSLVEMLGLE